MKVKLTKIQGKNNSSINVGYWVKGFLTNKVLEPGPGLYMIGIIDTSRHEPFDWFASTDILEVNPTEGGVVVTTKNSKWLVEEIK